MTHALFDRFSRYNLFRKLIWKTSVHLRHVMPEPDYSAMQKNIWLSFIQYEPLRADLWDGPLFVHIPKAAGNSVLKTGVKSVGGHHGIEFYRRRLPKDRTMPYAFTVVREPMARFVSAFYFLKAGGIDAPDKVFARRHITSNMDHNAFAEKVQETPDLLNHMHFRPQYLYLGDGQHDILVDHVLRFESLSKDWPAFAAKLGLSPKLEHVNRTAYRKLKRSQTTERCRAIIRELYARDYELLGYPLPQAASSRRASAAGRRESAHGAALTAG